MFLNKGVILQHFHKIWASWTKFWIIWKFLEFSYLFCYHYKLDFISKYFFQKAKIWYISSKSRISYMAISKSFTSLELRCLLRFKQWTQPFIARFRETKGVPCRAWIGTRSSSFLSHLWFKLVTSWNTSIHWVQPWLLLL